MTGDRTPDPADERRVRDALHDTVDDLEPVSGLAAIRSRVQEDAMNPQPSRTASRAALLALGGAAAVAVVVTGVVLVTQQSDRPSSEPPPAGTTSLTPSPTDDASASPSTDASTPSTPPPSAATQAVPVYYVGTTPAGPRLYREFHRLQVTSGDGLLEALREAVGTTALDPDYRSPWPQGTTVDAATSPGGQDVTTIDLSGPSAGVLHDRPAGMSRAEAEMAVQQLVYTAQAVLQARTPVQLLLDGKRTDQVLGVPTSEPLANGDEMSTLATVWITGPQDGDTLPADAVRITGRGAFFEATVAWQLLAADGRTVVKRGSAMSQECCVLSPYDFTIPGVQPGSYVIRVYDEDMSGGEGNGEMQDTKRITVE